MVKKINGKRILQVILTVLSVVSIDMAAGLSTYHPLNLLLFLIVLRAGGRDTSLRRRERLITLVMSACIALMVVMGSYERIMSLGLLPELVGAVREKYVIRVLAVIASFFGMLYFIWGCMVYVYEKLREIPAVCDGEHVGDRAADKKIFWGIFAAVIIIDMIVFLGFYPGILPNDAVDQATQAYGARAFSNHHPWLHTLFIKLSFAVGSLISDHINAGVAVYTVAQIMVMALIYAYVVKSLYEIGVKKKYLICCICFYTLIPYNVMYNLTMWKDTIFSGICLLLTVEIWKLLCGCASRFRWGKFVIWGSLMCLLRGNGVFAYVFTMVIFMAAARKKWKQIMVTAITAIGIMMVVKGPVMDAFEVTQTDTVEALSIPAQQIARVIADGNRLDNAQTELLEQIIDVDQIAGWYNPIRSDEIKNLVRAAGNQEYLNAHKMEYLKLWMEIGAQHPLEYWKAWIDQTRGYWYPDVQFWSIAYRIQENELNIVQTPIVKPIFSMMQYLSSLQFMIPGYAFLWSIGFMVWGMLVLAGYCLMERKYSVLACFGPAAGIWLTLLIATPVHAEFRYLYILFIAMPVLFLAAFQKKDAGEQSTAAG